MIELYFDAVSDILTLYSKWDLIPLADCKETIELYKRERKNGNPYRELAEDFEAYKKGKKEDKSNWYFYKYLESLDNKMQYQFPLDKGGTVTINVDFLNPYSNEVEGMIDPKWHLLVSYYAYKDAAYNHMDNEYANQITAITNDLYRKFRCKTLSSWMIEVIG